MTHPQDVEPAGLKLSPCPFCGGEAVFSENQIDFEPVWGVRCDDKCFAWIDACTDTKAEAAEVWNTRASPSPSGDVREAVARIVDPDAFARLDALVAERTASKHALLIREISPIIGPALAKADQIAALYVERIGVETASASEPVVDPGDGDGIDSTPLTRANKLRTSEEPQT